MVGGNATAVVIRASKSKNASGLAVPDEPEPLMELDGWLDYQAGQPSRLSYQAKLQDATHLWICDYREDFAALPEAGLSLEIGGARYEILTIDDPMGMHEHLETHLRRVGM